MLPVVDPSGDSTSKQILLFSLALIPVSLLPTLMGFTGWIYFFCALAGGLLFFGLSTETAICLTFRSARKLFIGSIAYLSFIFATLGLDKLIL